MESANSDTILLVCGCPETAENLMDSLYRGGFSVVGPVPTAGLAMTLAAQTLPTAAIIATPPSGRRGVAALGRDLMRAWGVRSWVMDGADACEAGAPSREWAVEPHKLDRLRRALLDGVL